MATRPGRKKTVGAWVTPELQSAIDHWRRLNPGTTQTFFALSAFAEKLRKDGIPIKDEDVFVDDRVAGLPSEKSETTDAILQLKTAMMSFLDKHQEAILENGRLRQQITQLESKRKNEI